MGYSLSWLAVRNISSESMLDRLALYPTGARAAYATETVSGQALPDGWFLVVARGCDHRIISESALSSVSVDTEVVACSIEEHVMVSSSEGWGSGKRLWRVEHDGQESTRNLTTSGLLPDPFAKVHAQAIEDQDAEDAGAREVDFFFEVPLVLAWEVVGFKHDENTSSLDYDDFEVFKSSKAVRQWWQIWK